MFDLAVPTLRNQMTGWGYSPVIVARTLPADAATLYGFLSDPANQWRLAGPFADVVALRPAGVRCDAELRLAWGAGCHASAHVWPRSSREVLAVQVRLGRRTVVWATWILTPVAGSTEVDLAVQFESHSLISRVALLLGGRRWIARRLDATLALLAARCLRAVDAPVKHPARRLDEVVVKRADVDVRAVSARRQHENLQPDGHGRSHCGCVVTRGRERWAQRSVGRFRQPVFATRLRRDAGSDIHDRAATTTHKRPLTRRRLTSRAAQRRRKD